MFNWVVKVVPQPAETPEGDEAAKTIGVEPPKSKEVKNGAQKNPEEVSEDSQQAGVIGWLSNGFVSALPQPPGSPRLGRANSDARLADDGERSGVIGWVAQGLTKVLPQPEGKYKEAIEVQNTATTTTTTTEEHTEVYDVATLPDYDPLPHIPVVEMVSEVEVSEVESLNTQFPPNVVNWIKQIIPQPVVQPPGGVPTEPPPKTSRSSLDKILSPPPESLSGISLDTDSKASGVVDWFVSGLGLKLPQLVIQPKDDSEGATEVLQKASSKLKPDMVLEDLESDNEGLQTCEDQTKAAAPSASASPPTVTENQQQEEMQHAQSSLVKTQCCDDATLEVPPESVTKICQEDAETQTGRWTPFIESIKREAEDVALATMEERLLQERIEMARLAEEVARQTAEMAVRQMASEGTSIKLSLGSQEQLEEPEAELPVPQEEEDERSKVEQREDTEKEETLLQDEQKTETEEPTIKEQEPTEDAAPTQTSSPPPTEPTEEAEPKGTSSPAQSPEQEKTSEPEPEPAPEPETKTHEAASEPQPLTQQPQKAEDCQVTSTDKEADASGDGCGEGLHPAVNVEDVDNEKAEAEKGRGGEEKSDIPQIPSNQDTKLTTLTVPVTPSGGRQSKGDKE